LQDAPAAWPPASGGYLKETAGNRRVDASTTRPQLRDPLIGSAAPLSQESERSVDALLVGNRLVVLSSRSPGAAVSVYALP